MKTFEKRVKILKKNRSFQKLVLDTDCECIFMFWMKMSNPKKRIVTGSAYLNPHLNCAAGERTSRMNVLLVWLHLSFSTGNSLESSNNDILMFCNWKARFFIISFEWAQGSKWKMLRLHSSCTEFWLDRNKDFPSRNQIRQTIVNGDELSEPRRTIKSAKSFTAGLFVFLCKINEVTLLIHLVKICVSSTSYAKTMISWRDTRSKPSRPMQLTVAKVFFSILPFVYRWNFSNSSSENQSEYHWTLEE